MADIYRNDEQEQSVLSILMKNPKYYVKVGEYLYGQVFRINGMRNESERILFYSWENKEAYVTGLFREIRVVMTNFSTDCTLVTGIGVVDDDGMLKTYSSIAEYWFDGDVFACEKELKIEKWGVKELEIHEKHYFTQDYLDKHCVDDDWVLFECSPENVLIMKKDGKVGAFHHVITKTENFCYKLLDYNYDEIEIMNFSGEETLSDGNTDRWFFMVEAKGKYGMFEMFCKDGGTDDCKIELKELLPCIYDKIELEERTVRLCLNDKNIVRSVNWKDVGKVTALECGEVFEYYARKALDMG